MVVKESGAGNQEKERILKRKCRMPNRGHMGTLVAMSFAAFTGTASGDGVVKDHVTETTLWSGTARIANWDDTNSTLDYIAACAFTGNGEILKQVEGIFWSESSTGVVNGADWANIDFRLIFYEDTAAFQADPRNGTQSFLLDVPDNVNWATPVATFLDSTNGKTYDLLHLVFEVESFGITTVAEQEQFVALTPTGNTLAHGQTGMMYSTGLAGAVGTELDLYVSYETIPSTGPDTLQNLESEGALFDYVPYRVVLVDVPCPADSDGNSEVDVLDLVALLAVWGTCPPPCPEDVNGDGEVDVLDLVAMLAAWGSCP